MSEPDCMPRRRILQVITNLGKAGAETQLAYLVTGLRQRDWDVHVAVLSPGFEDRVNRERIARSGACLHDIRARGSYDPSAIIRLARLIARLRPRLVQTWLPMVDVVGGMAALWTGVPWILTERASPRDHLSQLAARMKQALRVRLARSAAGVVSNARAGDAYWGEVLPRGLPRRVIGNAVPIDEIDAAAPADLAALGLPRDAPLIVYAGRLIESKNIEVMLEALARVAAQSDAVAVLCGVGPLEAPARAWIAARGLSGRIALAGFVPQIACLLKRARVFVSLSRTEGMPNTVMEAMAARVPLVLADIPSHREVADEPMARFVSLEDPEEAAGAMLAIVRDAGVAAHSVELARARAERWTIAAIAETYEAFYELVAPAAASSA